ncbi:putative transcription factor B3-Domain family [Helianthus debilis subsp. tardiflorus]
MFHTSFVFAKGWPEVCNDLRILDDDLLIFRRIDNVVFELLVYRNEIEILLSKKAEYADDVVLEISKANYFEKAFKDIYEDDKVASLGEGKVFSQKLQTNALPKAVNSRKAVKFDVECSPKKRMSSRMKKIKDKKGKVISDRKEEVKNTTKGFHATLPTDTIDDIGCSSSAHKVKNMVGVVDVYDVKTELNDGQPPYALDGWRKFMTVNNLKFGDMLHFTYVSSQQKIILNDVTSV